MFTIQPSGRYHYCSLWLRVYFLITIIIVNAITIISFLADGATIPI